MKFTRGFTLIEILLVIAIIGVLTTIMVIVINPAKRLSQARDAKRISNVTQIANALQAYYTQHGNFPDEDATSKTESRVLGVDCWGSSNAGTTKLNPSHQFLPALVTNGDLKRVPVEDHPFGTINPGFGWTTCSYRYLKAYKKDELYDGFPGTCACGTTGYAIIYTSLESKRGTPDQRPTCMYQPVECWGEGGGGDWGYAVYLPY